jgi:hypothetical protein
MKNAPDVSGYSKLLADIRAIWAKPEKTWGFPAHFRASLTASTKENAL